MPNLTVSEGLGAELKALRQARHSTQQDLAERAGTTAGYVSRVERGGEDVTLPMFLALLGGLGVPTEPARQLFSGKCHLLDDGSVREPSGLLWRRDGLAVLPAGCDLLKAGLFRVVVVPRGPLFVLVPERLAAAAEQNLGPEIRAAGIAGPVVRGMELEELAARLEEATGAEPGELGRELERLPEGTVLDLDKGRLALPGAPAVAVEVTPEEQHLLSLWRRLRPEDRAHWLRTFESLAAPAAAPEPRRRRRS